MDKEKKYPDLNKVIESEREEYLKALEEIDTLFDKDSAEETFKEIVRILYEKDYDKLEKIRKNAENAFKKANEVITEIKIKEKESDKLSERRAKYQQIPLIKYIPKTIEKISQTDNKSKEIDFNREIYRGKLHEIMNTLYNVQTRIDQITVDEMINQLPDEKTIKASKLRYAQRVRDKAIPTFGEQIELYKREVKYTEKIIDILSCIDKLPILSGYTETRENRYTTLTSPESEGIIIKYDNEIPPIKANPGLIELIYSNLISNSIKYAKEDGKTLEITISYNPETNTFCFSDNGPGIDKTFVDPNIIFEYGTTTKGTGTGLDLVKGIVKKYNANSDDERIIWVESNNECKGTTICYKMDSKYIRQNRPLNKLQKTYEILETFKNKIRN